MDHFIRMLCISWLNIWINKQIEVCILVVFYLRIGVPVSCRDIFPKNLLPNSSLRAIACSITQVAIIVNDIIISDIKQNQIVCEVSIESY